MSEPTPCASCGALVLPYRIKPNGTVTYRPIYNGDGTSSYRPINPGPKQGARCGLCGARRPIERLPPLEISADELATVTARAESAELSFQALLATYTALEGEALALREALAWALEAGGWRLWYYAEPTPPILSTEKGVGSNATIRDNLTPHAALLAKLVDLSIAVSELPNLPTRTPEATASILLLKPSEMIERDLDEVVWIFTRWRDAIAELKAARKGPT